MLLGCASQDQLQPQNSQSVEQEKTTEREQAAPKELSGRNNEEQRYDQNNQSKNQQNTNQQQKNERIVIESPQPDSSMKIGMSFELKGKAKIDATELHYEFEDGHNILSKGKFQLSSTRDAMGYAEFHYTIKLEQNPSSPFGTLILYALQKDGTKAEQIMVTYNFDPSIVKP